jgi:UDP-N-acetylmuramate dehydrogenase
VEERLDTERGLREIVGADLRIDEPMSRHTTIGVGGPARYLAIPRSASQVVGLVKFAGATGLEYTVLGKGSNLVVRDGGYDGLVIKMGSQISRVRLNRTTVFAEGGAALSRLARRITSGGRPGLEFAVGIPGTVGGAVVMNAGAFGGEIADVLESVKLVDENGSEKAVERQEIQFAYRKSSIPPGSVVLSATFRCPPGEIDEETYRKSLGRKETQPIWERTFGSTFVNPPDDHAARLIEACGLKGVRRGGAMVSPKHANFIVNVEGNATAKDVEDLMDLVRNEVQKRHGVILEPEVIVIGHR